MTKRKKSFTQDSLDSYGMGSHIRALITGETETLPDHLNWMELGNLYYYNEELRPKLTPWIDKMQQHFSEEDSECTLIIALAKSQEELKKLLLEEIVYIRKLLPLHEFWSLHQLIPKLKEANRKLALSTMKRFIADIEQNKIDHKITWLQAYYDVCTGKKEKADITEQIIHLAEKLDHDFQLRDLYKKIPDQRIADLWLTKLGKTREFRTLINAAIITKQDAFFQKAKPDEIIGVDSDTFHMLREKYAKCQDERFLDVWLHALNVFQKKENGNTVRYALEAYKATQDVRFMDFIQPQLKYYSQKLEFYALLPTPGILATLKKECNSFSDAKEAFVITCNEEFFNIALTHIGKKGEEKDGLERIIKLHELLMEYKQNNKSYLQKLKAFVTKHLDEFWSVCENTRDKEKFLKIM